MNQEQLLDKVRQVIADRLCRDWRSFTAETHLTVDLGCDSLDLAEIYMDLEDAFELRHYGTYEDLPLTIGAVAEFIKTGMKTLNTARNMLGGTQIEGVRDALADAIKEQNASEKEPS